MTYKTDPHNLLRIFTDKWKEIDPDLILSSSHATRRNLEMPYSTGNVCAKYGKLYAKFIQPENLPTTSKPLVYFSVGNCLIGDADNDKESMAIAWISAGGATAMAAYVVPTWYGRNGWGGLKFWLSAPGKHTLAEAIFLNQQDMVSIEYRKNPELLKVVPDFKRYGSDVANLIEGYLRPILNNVTKDDIGFVYDRDVLVYYGDPKWNVCTKEIPEQTGYDIKCEK